MAIFRKNEPQAVKPRERPVALPRGGATDGAISIIGQGMTVVGDVSTEGIVRVEGTVNGTIRAGKAVILGQAGLVEGNIYTSDAVIGGTVNGSIVASNRLELQGTCTVDGEITTRAEHLKLDEGARFAGQVTILEPEPQLLTEGIAAPDRVGTYQETAQPYAWNGDASSSFEGSEGSEAGMAGLQLEPADERAHGHR